MQNMYYIGLDVHKKTISYCVKDGSGIHPAAAASPSASTRNSFSGTANSAFPQFRQTNSSGKSQTMGFSRPFNPGKWMAVSAVNLL
jgi:hypothetical protein